GGRESFPDEGRDGLAVGPAGDLGGDGFHGRAHGGHAGEAAFGEGLGDDRPELVGREGGGQVGGEDLGFGQLPVGPVGPAGVAEGLGGLLPLLHLLGEDLDDLVVIEVAGLRTRHRHFLDGRQCHTQGGGGELVAPFHGGGEIAAESLGQHRFSFYP